MSQSQSYFVGFTPAVIALLCVLAYVLVVSFFLRTSDPQRATVVSYDPPSGISPALAAWLTEPGSLGRALAAALINMAAKRFLTIEQLPDFFSITKVRDGSFDSLEPEEDALAYALFQTDECVDFDQRTEQFGQAIKLFANALRNRTYFSSNIGLSIPAWIVSILASVYALFEGSDFPRLGLQGIYGLVLVTALLSLFYIAGLATMGDAPEKIVGGIGSRDAQQRFWTVTNSMPLIFLFLAAAGVLGLTHFVNVISCLILGAFLLIDAIFFYVLHRPNAMGKRLLERACAYREFLAAVDADVLTRTRSTEQVPTDLGRNEAYAVAFHLDLGWGERFVASIGTVVGDPDDLGESGGRQAYQVYRNL